jgi:hypothetical protein
MTAQRRFQFGAKPEWRVVGNEDDANHQQN